MSTFPSSSNLKRRSGYHISKAPLWKLEKVRSYVTTCLTCRSCKAPVWSRQSWSLSPLLCWLPVINTHTHNSFTHLTYVSQCILLSIGNTTCSYLLDEEPRVTGSSQYGGLLQAVLKDGLESRTQRASDQVIHCLSYSVISSQRVLNDKCVCMRQLSHLSPINRNSDTI